MDKVYGYIYCTQNKITGQIYIGRHKWSDPDTIDNTYYGSGRLIEAQIKQYGKSAFNVSVLARASTRTELIELEEYYIRAYMQQHSSEVILNKVDRGNSGFDTGEWNESRRASYLENRSRYGKEHNSVSHFGRVDGEYNGRYGKPVSQLTRNKISAANSGRVQSQSERESRRKSHMLKCPHNKPPSMKGYIRMNNGVVNRWVHPDKLDEFDGWSKGWIYPRKENNE